MLTIPASAPLDHDRQVPEPPVGHHRGLSATLVARRAGPTPAVMISPTRPPAAPARARRACRTTSRSDTMPTSPPLSSTTGSAPDVVTGQFARSARRRWPPGPPSPRDCPCSAARPRYACTSPIRSPLMDREYECGHRIAKGSRSDPDRDRLVGSSSHIDDRRRVVRDRARLAARLAGADLPQRPGVGHGEPGRALALGCTARPPGVTFCGSVGLVRGPGVDVTSKTLRAVQPHGDRAAASTTVWIMTPVGLSLRNFMSMVSSNTVASRPAGSG